MTTTHCPGCRGTNFMVNYSCPLSYECRTCGHTWSEPGPGIRVVSEEESRRVHPKLWAVIDAERAAERGHLPPTD